MSTRAVASAVNGTLAILLRRLREVESSVRVAAFMKTFNHLP